MQKLIILAALAAYCLAAPTIKQEDIKFPQIPLQRPSPINPDVISDPKPNEKITMITDPQEVAKHKREIEQTAYEPALTHLLPTLPPQHQHAGKTNENRAQYSNNNEHNSKSEDVKNQHNLQDPHHRQKREQKTSVAVEKNPTAVKPVEKVPTSSKPTVPKRTRKQKPSAGAISSTTSPVPQKRVAPVPETKKQRRRRDVNQSNAISSTTTVPVPLIFRDEHKTPYEGVSQAVYIKHEIPHNIPPAALAESQGVAPLKVHIPENVKPHTLPAAVPAIDEAAVVSPQTLPALSHALQADTHPIIPPTSSPATAHHAISNFATALGHAKRDIPVPLVPKYHHPEESPKEDDKKNEHNQNEVEKKTEENKDKVQVADITDKAAQHQPLQAQVPHHPQQHEFHPEHQHMVHKPLIVEHSEAVSSSTTDHPVIRHKPVPVAELFARPKQPEN